MAKKLSLDALVDAAWDALDDGDLDEAIARAEEAIVIDRVDADPYAVLGAAFFEQLEIDKAREHLALALEIEPEHADAHYWMGLVLERDGDEAGAARHLREATRLDVERYPRPVKLSPESFQREVETVLESLPQDFRDQLENLAIVVEPLPEDRLLDDDPPLPPTILGLHVGTPRPGHGSTPGAGPNTIFLFQKNLERAAASLEELREQIEVTLLHEIGHYLGLDEDDVNDRGLE